jgi:hypothetical protein
VVPEIHLPETILSVNVALGKDQVMFAGSINMRHTEGVPADINGTLQSGKLDIAIDFWNDFCATLRVITGTVKAAMVPKITKTSRKMNKKRANFF